MLIVQLPCWLVALSGGRGLYRDGRDPFPRTFQRRGQAEYAARVLGGRAIPWTALYPSPAAYRLALPPAPFICPN